jgi:hypothetical protein
MIPKSSGRFSDGSCSNEKSDRRGEGVRDGAA